MTRKNATIRIVCLFVCLLFSQTATALANLAPNQPPGWSDKLVVSRLGLSSTDDAQFYQYDVLFVTAPIINNGDTAVTTGFYNSFYVDGVLYSLEWVDGPILPGQSTGTMYGSSLPQLSVGTHTITIVVDPNRVVPESSYADNEYTKTITVVSAPPPPNLTPYFVPGWSYCVVIGTAPGATSNEIASNVAAATEGDTLYVNWAVINNGYAATAASFDVALYIDNVLTKTWTVAPPLNVNAYTSQVNFTIGTLPVGQHGIGIVADSGGTIRESDELDNGCGAGVVVTAKKRRGQISSQ